MQIVIEIPDRIYKISQNRTLNITDAEILEKAVKNGIPLPKGHGRLKDVDKIVMINSVDIWTDRGYEPMVTVEAINGAPTVIEALERQPCEDCISREEALMALTGDITDCTIEEFIARLRDKLSKLPSVAVTANEDCISRKAVDELSKELVHTTKDKVDFLCNFWEGLQKLPSVTPKEKTGHWIFDEILDRHYYCSECKSMGVDYWDYCPICGARMEAENDS